MEKKKIVVQSLLVFLIGALIFGATRFQTTYAYFSDSGDAPLSYLAKLNNLYSENGMKLIQATFDVAKLQFVFDLNSVVKSNETDQYEVKIPTSCTFDKVTTTGTVENTNDTTRTVTFAANRGPGSIAVDMTCSIRVNRDVHFDATIMETIGNNPTFQYKKITYHEGYDEYVKHINQVEDTEKVPEDDVYNKFIAWVKAYNAKSGIQDAIGNQVLQYVGTVFKNNDSFKDEKNFDKLPGISISYDTNTKEYTFNALDNLVGYARTYVHYRDAQATTSVLFYFSTSSRNAVYQALLNYLNNYIYPKDKAKATMVYDYAYDNDIISSLMNGNFVSGWTLVVDNDNPGNTMVRFTKGFIESDSLSAKEKMPYVAFDSPRNMLAKVRSLVAIYYADIPEAVRTEIFNRTDIITSLQRNNNTVSTKESFKDYFIHKNGNEYVLIEISSDSSKQPGFNKVMITHLPVPSTMTVTFNNTNQDVTIQISDTTKESVLKTLGDLNTYFGTSIQEKDVTSSTLGNQQVIEYKITK